MSIPENTNPNGNFQQELARISQLFENTKINYQVLDEDGIICYVNQPWLDTLGFEKQDVLGKSFSNFLTPESRILFHKHLEKCHEPIANGELELIVCCADGSEIVASFSCFCNPEINGSSQRSHCTFQNITRLRDTEKALRASEDNYKHIFNSFRDIYYQADNESRILLISPSIEKIGGYKPEELKGRSVADFFATPEIRERFRAKLFKHGSVDDYDVKLRKKNGEFIDASISAQVVRNKEEDTFYLEGVIRDITRRKKYESEIASFNERLQDITDSLPVVLFQLNQIRDNFHIEYISPNVTQRFDLSLEEIKSGPEVFEKVLSKKVLKDIFNELNRAHKEERAAEIDFDIPRKDGPVEWCRIKVSPRKNGADEITWTGIAIDITTELNSRRKIEAQESQLKALHQFANVGIATMSPRGIVTSINPAVTEITGYTGEEIVGKHFKYARVFLRKDLSFYMKLYSDALRGKIPKKGVQFEWKHKNGERRWAEAFLNLIRENGKISGFQGVFLDVTDRILLEKERQVKLKDSDFLFNSALGFLKIKTEEELYQFLAKQMRKQIPEAIINLNSVNDDLSKLRVESVTGMTGPVRNGILKLIGGSLKGKIFNINFATFSYAKHGKLIQIHDNLYDLAVHQIPQPVCNQIEKLIQLREIHEISIGVGDKIMGGCAIFLCKDQKLENKHLIENLFRQATQALTRLQTRRKLEQKEELYRSLAENTMDMILRVRENHRVIYANQAFLDTFKLQADRIYDQSMDLLGLPDTIRNLILKTAQKTITSQKSQFCDNALVIDETPRFFEWRMFPEKDSKNGEKSVLMFIHDITLRKEAESRVMANIENKNKIYRLIGHDLKNPLNSIMGFLELLTIRFDHLSDDMKIKYLGYINDSSENLYQLLDSMQEWSKADEQKENFKPLFFDLRLLIDATLDILKLGFLEKSIKIENGVPYGTLINADYNMIAAAVRNILSNSCKFSYENGSIKLSLKQHKKIVILKIKDEGTGMSESEVKSLMNAESSFTKTGTKGERGSGFGFTFAQEFITRNQGWIRLKSQPGKGTEIQIGLPAG